MMEKTNITKLAAAYQDLLAFDGNTLQSPLTDDDGNIRLYLTASELNFLFMFSKVDAGYVRIVLPDFFSLDLDEDKVNALVAMNHVATVCKVAKLNLNAAQNNVIATIEYMDHGNSVDIQILKRYLGMLVGAVKEFIQKMRDLQKVDEAA